MGLCVRCCIDYETTRFQVQLITVVVIGAFGHEPAQDRLDTYDAVRMSRLRDTALGFSGIIEAPVRAQGVHVQTTTSHGASAGEAASLKVENNSSRVTQIF